MTHGHRSIRSHLTRSLSRLRSTDFRARVIALAIFPLITFALIVGVQLYRSLEAELRSNLIRGNEATAREIAAAAANPLLINDFQGLYSLLHRARDQAHLEYAILLDGNGAVVAHALVHCPIESVEAALPEPAADRLSSRIVLPSGPLWNSTAPLDPAKLGTVHVGHSEHEMSHTLNEVVFTILWTGLAMIALIVCGTSGIAWAMTRPLRRLSATATALVEDDSSLELTRTSGGEIAELQSAFATLFEAVQSARNSKPDRDELRSQFTDRVVSAQEEERKRISRELHDETSQALTSLILGLRNLEDSCSSEESGNRVREQRTLAEETLAGIHELCRDLRPHVLDELGLVAALEHHAREFGSHSGLSVDLAVRAPPVLLPPPLEMALFRIVQECLTNIARHARASSASILLDARPRSITLVVEDDGTGFDLDKTINSGDCLGLYGMMERASLFGGDVTVETSGAGTSVYVHVPLDPSPAPAGAEPASAVPANSVPAGGRLR